MSSFAYCFLFFFFFNDTATTEIYPLSLHDALPISAAARRLRTSGPCGRPSIASPPSGDRKSTRLNSRHDQTSYAGFCLKKKKKLAEAFQRMTDIEPGHQPSEHTRAK